MTSYKHLLDHACSLKIIDTHEHLPGEKDWASWKHDILTEWMRHYISSDIISAGLSQKTMERDIRGSSLTVKEKWNILEPYWNAVKNTGYARVLDHTARDIYGLPGVNSKTIGELDRIFNERRENTLSGQSYYRHILKEKSGIEISIVDGLDGNSAYDRSLFRYAYRPERFITPQNHGQISLIAKPMGSAVKSLDDWKHLCEKTICSEIEKGAVALKSGTAYWRSLYFPETDEKQASDNFMDILHNRKVDTSPFQNFMMHHIMKVADGKGLVFQIHTGLQEGNGNCLSNSNPEHLANLFLKYQNVTFDIFHISYPYQNILSALSKNFPNVMIDMCWSHIISPTASVNALVEFLDAVPSNKICGFGGDYIPIDGVYGHQKIARQNIAKALSIKVDEGVFDLDYAKEICKMLLIDNPKRIFKL
ncbi:MAG TPA: amidohydrolase [Lentisphaeria bacterium]|nr:MAG: hypothetical protein A2X45_02050 [Lentisphaerae bacterium GWF2_50_93]HCE45429.1 amidohydrolase [Lentisphaeria bacterium]